jgi:hypothetical protein
MLFIGRKNLIRKRRVAPKTKRRSKVARKKDRRKGFYTETAEDTERTKEVEESKVEKLREEGREERRVVARAFRQRRRRALGITQRRGGSAARLKVES